MLSDEKLIRTCYEAIRATGSEPAENENDMLEMLYEKNAVALSVLSGLRAVAEAAVKDAVGGEEPVAWARNLTDPRPDTVTDLIYCSVAEHERGDNLLYIPLYTRPQASAAVPDVPQGAIHNGRAFADRLESEYKFECEAGPLHLCGDWQELRRCFEHLADWASILAASQPEVKS